LAAIEWQASATRIALLAVAYIVPLALVAPFAGVFVDRWELRRILIASDLARAALVTAMTFASNHAMLCVLLFLHQSCGCFFNPAQAAALPRLVDRSQLLAANALTAGAGHAAKILGPALAGILVAAFGWRGCLYADAVSFALSALALATLPRFAPVSARRGTDRRFGAEIRADLHAGWSFLASSRPVLETVLLVTIAMAALGGFLAVIAVYARERLEAGPRSMGLLLSMLGAGAVLGALGVARYLRPQPKQRIVCGGILTLALAFVLLAQARSLGLAAVAIFVLGAAAAAVIVPAQTLVQEETPPALLGRVTSVAVAAIGLAQGASMLLAGPVSTTFGFTRWLMTLACGVAICAVAGLASGTKSRATP
jgi:predicted MFS family arabinose efflux permease